MICLAKAKRQRSLYARRDRTPAEWLAALTAIPHPATRSHAAAIVWWDFLSGAWDNLQGDGATTSAAAAVREIANSRLTERWPADPDAVSAALVALGWEEQRAQDRVQSMRDIMAVEARCGARCWCGFSARHAEGYRCPNCGRAIKEEVAG